MNLKSGFCVSLEGAQFYPAKVVYYARRFQERTISYLDKVSFDALPILPTGTCVLAGLSAQVPVIIKIDKIKPKKFEPFNKTIRPTDFWKVGNDAQNTKQTEIFSQDDEIIDDEEDDLPF